jgi:Tol biopolymer transport system component
VIPGGAGLLAVERNGIQLDGPLWRLPLPGGTARRVGAIIAHDATESNDHADILYARANDLFITDEQGLNTRKLATVAGWAWRPHFAPDKQTLRFTLFDAASNSLSLWEMRADGGNLHELLRGWNRPAHECCGDWTPDGRYFFFASETKGKSDIWLLQQPRLFHTGNPQPVRLTSGPMNFSDPVAAADGRTLFVLGRTERTELSRYDARTRAFVPYFGGVSADGIDFSRDGHWIAWTSYPDNSLWRSKTDGSQKLQLTSAPLEAHLPQWSPDGKEIVFIGKAPGEALKICVVSASDGSLRRLTSGPQNDAAPTWSRDGKWIAFAGAPWLEGGPSNNYVIRLLNVSTHETSVLPGSAGLFAPRISPDGAYLAALTVDATKLMLFSFRTQKWTELAAPGFGMLSPVWSHDSRYVYFNNLNFRRDPAVFRIGVAERKFERVAAFQGLLRVALGNWAPFSALAPDDSVLVLRDVGSEEVYALELQ